MTSFRPHLAIMVLLLGTPPATLVAQGTSVRRVAISDQRVIRIPLQSPAQPPPRADADVKETRGPKCVARSKIAGATLSSPKSIDLTLHSGTRLRAKLQNRCPAIDYYAGFYLNPTVDGDICADRDAFHARSGGECQIDVFNKLSRKTIRAKR